MHPLPLDMLHYGISKEYNAKILISACVMSNKTHVGYMHLKCLGGVHVMPIGISFYLICNRVWPLSK